MRATPAVLRLALCLSSLTPIVSAWPGWLPARDSLYVRQDNEESESTVVSSESEAEETASRTTGTSESSEAPAEETSATSGDDEDEDEDNDEATTTGPRDPNTAVIETGTGTRTGTATGRATTSISIDPAGYAGGIEMLTPNTVQVASALYKVGDNIELAWNYTNVLVTPTAIDVLVSCSAASETWTLTANMTFETEVNFIWETEDDADNADKPLLTEMYTLIVKDVDAEVTERPSSGYLGAYSGFVFGLYHPIAYTPLADWECTVCNAGPGGFDSQALKMAVTMALITFCGFTWFVAGLGLE
jgi:hypothetical protein